MFRHKGDNRTYIHNLRLASMLSFVAGLVNITGVLSVRVLTTNVTGHFAYFSEQVLYKNYATAFEFLVLILCFLSGAFFSNLFIEIVSRRRPAISHVLPMMIEIIILVLVGLFGHSALFTESDGELIACSLLFAMGLQNALVTKVSRAVVRTTHLTGLFTDLGIELSQLFFYRKQTEFQKLKRSIYLRLVIIAFFFAGCFTGGYIFESYAFKTLLFAAGWLVIALLYDNIRFGVYHLIRKVQAR